MKQNDWIVATLNNPTYTIGDFQTIANMSLDNTQFLSRDKYLKSNYIREHNAFKDADGLFSEELFNRFYDNAANKFALFSLEDEINNYEYNMWDVTAPTDAQTQPLKINVAKVPNPDKIKIGIGGINEITYSDKSKRELAQESKIYDPTTNTYLDYSVNDISLFSNPIEYFKSWFDDPLVYATYDEDTIETDPLTGKLIKHQKGEWKLNEDGNYYTEKLNGRSLLDKTIVSVLDYITDDNTEINRYDFFDADGLDKSIGGAIIKNVVAALPIFIPYVGEAYSAILIGRELSKTLPMLYGIVNTLSGNEVNDNQLLNTIAAYGEKFTGSTSDYAQENTFSVENFLNLASDVALLWGLQSTISKTFNKLTSGSLKVLDDAVIKAKDLYLKEAQNYIRKSYTDKLTAISLQQLIGTNRPGEVALISATNRWLNTLVGQAALNKYLPAALKLAANRMRAGQDLSLVYMALISNTDVYQSVLEKGGTPQEAAAIALGSTIGMFGVDRFAGLGKMFFLKDGARLALRQGAREAAATYMATKPIIDVTTLKGIIGTIKKGVEVGKKAVDNYFDKAKYGGLSLVGKSLGEGLEEVSEELVADSSRWIGEILGLLGYFSQTDYGAWENAFDRYAMSFFGGSIGGAMFGAREAWLNRDHKIEEFLNDITYLLRQGKKNEIISELKKLRKEGKLGSKTLSYVKASNDTDAYLTADENNKSQADVNYEGLVSIINLLDLILNLNGLNLSEDEVFDKLVQGEYRAQALSDFLKGDNAENAKAISYISRYQEDLAKLTQAIENKELEIQEKINNTDSSKRNNPEFKEQLDKLKAEKQSLLDEKDYLFGEGSLGYVEKTLFAMNPILNRNFGTFNFNQFVRYTFNCSIDLLNEEELKYANELFKKLPLKLNLDEAFKLFKLMGLTINSSVQELQLLNPTQLINNITLLRQVNPFDKLLTYLDKLDTESDEEFLSLASIQEGETKEQYKQRITAHNKAIDNYNLLHIYKWIQEFLQNPITSTDFRYIVGKIGQVKSLILRLATNGINFSNDNSLTLDIRDIIQQIGVKNKIKLYTTIQRRIEQAIKDLFESKFITEMDDEGIVSNILSNASNLSPEEKKAIGIPEDYEFTPGIITYRDMGVYVRYMNAQNGWDLDTIIDMLSKGNEEDGSEYWDLRDTNLLSGDLKQLFDFLAAVLANPRNMNIPLANEIVTLDSENYTKMLDLETARVYDDFKIQLDENLINLLENNEVFETLTELEESSFINNPVIPILDSISKLSPNKNINIEKFLQNLYITFSNLDSRTDFILSDDQLNILNQILQDLDTASAYIYAASSTSPIGHNKSLNLFVKNHKDVFPNYLELPEINSNIADFLLGEIIAYKKEIQLWINLHTLNKAETEVLIFKSELALTKGIIDYFKIYRNSFKLSDSTDLLNGYESLSINNNLSSVIALQELLFNNFNTAISKDWTIEKILDEVLPKIVKIDNVLNQSTAKLNEEFTYNNFTDYDKFQLFISSIAVSSVKYYLNLYNYLQANDSLAPISIQEYVSKLVFTLNENPLLINKALQYIQSKTGTKLDIAWNTTIVSGLGGAGKTFAVAKLNLGEGENTWLCGPTEDLVNNLLTSLPKGQGVTKEKLLQIALGGTDIATVYNEIQLDYVSSAALKTEFKPATINDAPKTIVFDEATHLSTAEALVISKFCKDNNINLILMGDYHLNGFSAKKMGNLENNLLLSWRTPDLYLSLRNNNVHKTENLRLIINMLDILSNASNATFASIAEKLYNELFKNITFKYYNQDTLAGDIILNSIPTELLDKIPKENQIGFIGTEDSDTYKLLKNAGFKIQVMSPANIQGLEFDYVIVDLLWNFNTANNWHNTGVNLISFLKNLYTLMSRSKVATIFIDNGLSNYVNNVESNYNGNISIISQSVLKFRDKRIPEIEQALNDNQRKVSEEPADDQTNEIVRKTQYRDKNGNNVTGLYVKTIQNGITVITYEGDPEAMIYFGAEDIGVTIKDLLGPQGDMDNLAWDALTYEVEISSNAKVLPIKQVIIDSEGNITILSSIFNATGEVANKIYETFLKDGLPDYVSENRHITHIGNSIIKENDIENEENPERNNENINKEELGDGGVTEDIGTYNIGSPIRVYSNISYSGIDTSLDIWRNDSDSKTDLGIFIRPGMEIDNKLKHQYAEKVLLLKNIFTYGINYYNKLSLDTRLRFSQESFKNAEYYVVIDSVNNNNRLIGLTEGTGLSNENRTINNKIVKLVAKIKDNDGTIYTLSLGGLANPNTWEQNKDNIKAAIKLKIDNNIGNVELLTAYLNDLDNIILKYKKLINKWTATNQEIRLKNKPIFHGDTLIKELDNTYRLEEMNTNYSPYNNAAPMLRVSSIYAMIDDIPGVKSSIKGHAVRFISSNLLLSPTELKDLYLAQAEDPTLPKMVRMLVLNNLGVSFKSLYQNKYSDIYQVSNGSTIFTLPFEAGPMGLRMYIAAWNFRADLNRFIETYNNFLHRKSLTELLVEELCKLDNLAYNEFGKTAEIVNEAAYRRSVSEELASKLKVIWEFNDDLGTFCREFRLGYSSGHGAYLRKLTNITNDFYKDPNNVVGIYINPDIARLYLNALNSLFDNVINKIIPTSLTNISKYITTKLADIENWFKNVEETSAISLSFKDGKDSETVTINIDNTSALNAIPFTLTRIGLLLNMYRLKTDIFADLEENDINNFSIFYNKESLDWFSIIDAFPNIVETDTESEFKYLLPGIIPYKVENDVKIGVIDSRIDDMFSLMFHGLVSTKIPNDFTRGDIRATAAPFKYGFFTDPLIKARAKNGESLSLELVITNLKLFSSNLAAAGNLIMINLDEETLVTEEKPVEETPVISPIVDLHKLITPLLTNGGIILSEKVINSLKSIQNYIKLIKTRVTLKFDKYFSGIDTTPITELIESIEYKNDEVIFHKFIERPELKGHTISEVNRGVNNIEVILDNGVKYTIQIVSGNVIFNTVSEPKTIDLTVGNVRENIFNVLDKYTDENIEDGISTQGDFSSFDEIIGLLDLRLEGNTNISQETLNIILNNILNYILEMYEETDWANNLISELSDYKNTVCSNIK